MPLVSAVLFCSRPLRQLLAETGFFTPPFCQCCEQPPAYAIGDYPCRSCFAEPPPLTHIRICLLYNYRLRQFILRLKHGDMLHFSRLFAHFLQAHFTALAEPDHLIVPILPHAKRYLDRRFNQSAELARLLCQQNETSMFAPETLTQQKAVTTTRPVSTHRQSASAVDW